MLIPVLSGCATTYTTTSKGFTGFLVFDGNQVSWPRASSSLTEVNFALPVYLGLPSKPYRVLGFVVDAEPKIGDQTLPSWLWTDETRLANACNQAKERGADALLLTNDPTILRAMNATEGPNGKLNRLLTNFDGVIVAIKWGDHRF
jgi:hypothetical protein